MACAATPSHSARGLLLSPMPTRRCSTAGPTSRPGRTSESIDELQRLRGRQFDPELVPIFADELEHDSNGVPPAVELPSVATLEPELASGI